MSRRLGLSLAATQYGASMGRSHEAGTVGDFDRAQPVRLRKVPLNAGGYDEGGAYWGHKWTRGLMGAGFYEALYLVEGPSWEGGFDACLFLRALSRADAVKRCKELGFIVKGRQS
jgi:hypothetical protein